ncbi:MAG: transposase [Desulfovibrio sp.]|nr:transposase [Desulfovibrio sp.]
MGDGVASCVIFKTASQRKDAAGSLVWRLMRAMDNLRTFLKEEGIGSTNNHAERMLQCPVRWRKRSFGTDCEKGERFVKRITYLVC